MAAADGMTALKLAAEAGHFEAARHLAELGAEMPEEGLAVAPPAVDSDLGRRLAASRQERRALENPGNLALTTRLANQLLLDFEAAVDIRAAKGAPARCAAAAERWGFAPTELGYRRLLRVVEEAGADAGRLKSALQDTGALPKDPARDGVFDWDEIGGIDD